MKTIPCLFLALALATLPILTGCWQCEGGPEWRAYYGDIASVTIDARTPILVPLAVSAPTPDSPDSIDTLAVEIAMTDCSSPLTVDVRLLRADGTAIPARNNFGAMSAAAVPLGCPDQQVVFMVPVSALTCADGRCSVDLEVELTSERGAGPREVEAHLLSDDCRASVRRDGTIDAWGV